MGDKSMPTAQKESAYLQPKRISDVRDDLPKSKS
jgi:hypothetical protein